MALPGPTTPAPVAEVFGRVKGWLSAPFTTPLNPSTFAMCVVLALSVAYLWSRVLRNVFGER